MHILANLDRNIWRITEEDVIADMGQDHNVSELLKVKINKMEAAVSKKSVE